LKLPSHVYPDLCKLVLKCQYITPVNRLMYIESGQRWFNMKSDRTDQIPNKFHCHLLFSSFSPSNGDGFMREFNLESLLWPLPYYTQHSTILSSGVIWQPWWTKPNDPVAILETNFSGILVRNMHEVELTTRLSPTSHQVIMKEDTYVGAAQKWHMKCTAQDREEKKRVSTVPSHTDYLFMKEKKTPSLLFPTRPCYFPIYLCTVGRFSLINKTSICKWMHYICKQHCLELKVKQLNTIIYR